ncbi:hypothetical protein ABT071_04160 [Streptomyces sp. NPDC002506]|uniref:hypothetical protein n=1 Tax=Streptomyces sp. NPDC002506 TaxID=3154536 RepID=UPI00331F3462
MARSAECGVRHSIARRYVVRLHVVRHYLVRLCMAPQYVVREHVMPVHVVREHMVPVPVVREHMVRDGASIGRGCAIGITGAARSAVRVCMCT